MQIQSWHITGGGFHFGRQGLGQEVTAQTFSSDSLFAALVSRLAESTTTEQLESFIEPFNAWEPPFVLSSTFPFAGPVRFFPLPKNALLAQSEEGSIRLKELKRVQYVSEGFFRQLLSGTSLTELYLQGESLQGNSLLLSAEERSSLPHPLNLADGNVWSIERRPRVALGRSVQTSSIYFTGRVTYAQGCGLWFAIHWLGENSPLESTFAELMVELGDSGLGAERSSGFGACQIKPAGELELPDSEGQLWVSLSRYLPRQEEVRALLDPRAAYSLDHVGGWLDSPAVRGQRRRPVNLITAGSVLGPLDSQAPGQMVDLRPRYPSNLDPIGHPVYRSGFALPVGLSGGVS